MRDIGCLVLILLLYGQNLIYSRLYFIVRNGEHLQQVGYPRYKKEKMVNMLLSIELIEILTQITLPLSSLKTTRSFAPHSPAIKQTYNSSLLVRKNISID